MTNPVILLGTQSNGETLPVQVDATGRLVAEGLQGQTGEPGAEGPQGPQGPPGPGGGSGRIPIEEPANPSNGDLWLDTTPCPAVLKVWTECPSGEWMEYDCIPLLLLDPPTLQGSAQVSQLLILSPGTTNGGEPPYSITYQFIDASNGTILQDGTSNEFLCRDSDEGRIINGTFTATDSRGTTKISEASNSAGPIEKAPWSAEVDFVIVGGGGSAIPHGEIGFQPGGGGGYLSSVPGERSGGDTDPLPRIAINDQTAKNAFTVSIGGVDEPTSFSGLNITREALAGGSSSTGGTGAGYIPLKSPDFFPGTPGQGFEGGVGGDYPFLACEQDKYICDNDCKSQSFTGGGGGSGSPAQGMNGGNGTPSLITGQYVYRGGGGAGRYSCESNAAQGSPGMRPGEAGQGGSMADDAMPGVLILSMPNFLDFQRYSGNFTSRAESVGDKNVVTITSGFGEGRFVVDAVLFETWLKATHNDYVH